MIVCDTETIKGKPYTIQFYDGIKTTLKYVNERTILDVYCDYVAERMEPNLSVWFFYCQFDLPIIHYMVKEYFTHDNHKMGLGEFDFSYITGKTWFGNHTYKGVQWYERDAFQYVFTGLEKVAKSLKLTVNKKPRPNYLGERAPITACEKEEFEAYAIADVLVLWELVFWILSIHRNYDVGLSVSLADLCGKVFRKKFVDTPILPTRQEVTLAALASYHGGKSEMYVPKPSIVMGISEYDITSAYPYAMSQIANFQEYEIENYKASRSPLIKDGVYCVSGQILCPYHPLYSIDFKRVTTLEHTWVTGYELESAFRHTCFEGIIHDGYVVNSHNGSQSINPLAEYVWHFFTKKQDATAQKNATERLTAKLALNSLYGKFLSKLIEEGEITEWWRGGIIFHPLIGTLITGCVRGYVHDIEHVCKSLHTSTDSFITRHTSLDTLFVGQNGLGGLVKEYEGDALIIRPKVYVIFDKLNPSCYHKFNVNESTYEVSCVYCQAKVLKSATHGFFGSTQMLLNMWRGEQTNYMIKRMYRLKEAARRKDPDLLPFVFSKQRRSLNVDWRALTIYKGE